MDDAGNVGTPSTPAYVFLVDATLPVDPSYSPVTVSDGDNKGTDTNKVIIGVVAGVGGLLVIAVIVGIVVARRKVQQHHAGGPPAHMPSHGIAMMPAQSYMYGPSPMYGGPPPPPPDNNSSAYYQATVQVCRLGGRHEGYGCDVGFGP